MDANKLARRLDAEFPGALAITLRSEKRLYVGVLDSDKLTEVVGSLHEQAQGLRLATATGIDLRDGIGVFHHFVINGQPLVITVKVVAPKPEPKIPSLATRLPSAKWIEREIHEMLGVEFVDHPDPRPLLKARAFDERLYPLRREFDVKAFKEEIGEQLEW